MITFAPVLNAAPAVGLVLRLGATPDRYLRITHVFPECCYGMWVGEPEMARAARRPQRFSNLELQGLERSSGTAWGRIELPRNFLNAPLEGTDKAASLDAAWNLIFPLISEFASEGSLHRDRYESLIRERATAAGANFLTTKRLLHRYFYFGSTRCALVALPKGTKAGSKQTEPSKITTVQKRRGRQSVMSSELGENDFAVTHLDRDDMVACLKRLLGLGPTYRTQAHEQYLADWFSKRHPAQYKEYIDGTRQLPVTLRQYNYYVDRDAHLGEALVANLRTYKRNKGSLGSVYASGPGEVYEIDATGGRMFLVAAGPSPTLIGKPTIYLMIDRWSRFVVSAYMSTKSPSFEEVRHCLLVAFTSRERRFRALGVNIDDARWPVGRMPAVICHDRGSEFMCSSMEQAVMRDLRIEMTALPPYCPDGKAIVERLIRELKRRMASSGLKGVYADRPLDPETKKVAKRAQSAAVHSLAEAYRLLIEIIDDHNNRPHSALRKKRILAHAGVAPTPKAAYIWGLEHITGQRVATFSDHEYKRMLLASDTASIGAGVVRYKGRPYLPADETAIELANRSTKRATQVIIRIDKTEPHELFVVTTQGRWAAFELTRGGQAEIANTTLDEEEAFASHAALLWASSEHESKISRVKAINQRPRRANRPEAKKLNSSEQLEARSDEAASLKKILSGTEPTTKPHARKPTEVQPDWMKFEEEERQRNLALIRKHRKQN